MKKLLAVLTLTIAGCGSSAVDLPTSSVVPSLSSAVSLPSAMSIPIATTESRTQLDPIEDSVTTVEPNIDEDMLSAEQYRELTLEVFRTDLEISGSAVYLPAENAYDVAINVKNNGPKITNNIRAELRLGPACCFPMLTDAPTTTGLLNVPSPTHKTFKFPQL
jgi:hypothetical protein